MPSGEEGSPSLSSSEERLNVTDLAGGGWEEERTGCKAAEEGERARGVFRPVMLQDALWSAYDSLQYSVQGKFVEILVMVL